MPKYTVKEGLHIAEDGRSYTKGQTFESASDTLDETFIGKFNIADDDAPVTKAKRAGGTNPDRDSDKSDNMTGDIVPAKTKKAQAEADDEDIADLEAPKKGKKAKATQAAKAKKAKAEDVKEELTADDMADPE